MAVEILCLKNDGTAGRKHGAIIHIEECGETEHVRWGRRENPATAPNGGSFFIIRVPGLGKQELDPKILAYGEHKSRCRVALTRLPGQAKADIAARKVPTMALSSLSAALDDDGENWR